VPAQRAVPRDDLGPDEGRRDREKVLIVPVEGALGPLPRALRGPYPEVDLQRLQRDIEARLERDPSFSYILLRLDTPGGEWEVTSNFAHYIAETLKGKTTIAWIPEGKRALSGGTLIALAAKEIVMGPGTQIGAVAPVDPKGTPFDEKYQAPVRNAMLRYSSMRNRPELLVEAMVTKAPEDILRVETSDNRGGLQVRYLYRSEAERIHDRLGEELVLRRGQILVLNEQQAASYGFSRATAASRNEVFVKLNILIADENVEELYTGPIASSFPAGQRVVDFFNTPLVRLLLLLGGCLGLLLELKMPGTMIPGVSGLFCFLIFFITSLLPVSGTVAGTATLFDLFLFSIGLGLLAVEFFLLPGVGIFALSGAALCAVALLLAMVPSDPTAAAQHMSFKEALMVLVGGFGAGAVAFLGLLRALPRSSWLARGGIVNYASLHGVPTADNVVDLQVHAAAFLGKAGVVETALRPAGKVILDSGELLDVVADGEFIERGERVVVQEYTSTRIVVAREAKA
jgi:membrane-bound serine protease (ClpP class)